jgi:hypothetical protein
MVNGGRCEGAPSADRESVRPSSAQDPVTDRCAPRQGRSGRVPARILLEALDEIDEPVSTQDWQDYDAIQEELISLMAGSDLDDRSNMNRVISETVVQ